jgi:hypothetical protein
VIAAAHTKVTLVRGSGSVVASVVGNALIGELTANCEHSGETDRGEYVVGYSGRALTWRVRFCDRCWDHFRTHQEVIDLSLFEDTADENGR